MKSKSVVMCMVLMALALWKAEPVSATTDKEYVTVDGTRDYDEANKVIELVNQERAAEGLILPYFNLLFQIIQRLF